MGNNCILFGWNRGIPGREDVGMQHFGEFSEYLGSLQAKGTIQGFDAVFLEPHGSALSGFFLIRGESDKLAGLSSSETWLKHLYKAGTHIDSVTLVHGVTGEAVGPRMALYGQVTAEMNAK